MSPGAEGVFFFSTLKFLQWFRVNEPAVGRGVVRVLKMTPGLGGVKSEYLAQQKKAASEALHSDDQCQACALEIR